MKAYALGARRRRATRGAGWIYLPLAALLVMPVVFLATLAGAALSVVTP